MNSTTTEILSSSNPYEYSTIILAVLFITSEVLPFLKKHKGNGLTDTILCLLSGSSCLADKLADTIEQNNDEPENKV
ncbi:MAG: hypothetical protein ACR2M9_01900 [Cyanophyceae cyanobacterium]